MMRKNFMHRHLRIFVVRCSRMKFYTHFSVRRSFMNKEEQLKRLICKLYRQDEPEDYTDECIRNIRQYLLTALYNAPVSINSHYAAQVNHDLYG